MYWAISNLVDGQEPSSRRVEPDWPLRPDEILVNEDPTGKVWDAANRRLRPRTDAEVLAAAKRDAKTRLEGRASTEMTNVMPVYRALLLLARNSADPRFTQLRAVDDKLSLKHASVDAATTLDAVAEAEKWEA
jgi:hypothetical protein